MHCKLTNRLVIKTCTMKMNNKARSILPGPLVPPGRHGKLIVAGQMAMATGRDSLQTMPAGGAGSPIGRRPSGTRVEDATGAWTVCPVHRAPPGIGKASEGRSNGIWGVEDEEAIGYVEMDAKSKKVMHFIKLTKQYKELVLTT